MSRSRGWCLTLNNYSEDEYLSLLSSVCSYVILGRERGQEGTPHIQGYMYFATLKSLAQVRLLSDRAHWEIAKGTPDENYVYCSKQHAFEERGSIPISSKEKGKRGGDKSKAIWAENWALAKSGDFEKLNPAQIRTWEYIYAKYSAAPSDRSELTNIWIHGPSGCGKSRFVRENYPSFYSKPMSKWWDGYSNEDVVVLDDFAPEHGKFLGYFLKIWADHYVFNAEVKGGMLRIRPKIVIVTSQYPLYECFDENETVVALTRRFEIKRM